MPNEKEMYQVKYLYLKPFLGYIIFIQKKIFIFGKSTIIREHLCDIFNTFICCMFDFIMFYVLYEIIFCSISSVSLKNKPLVVREVEQDKGTSIILQNFCCCSMQNLFFFLNYLSDYGSAYNYKYMQK